MRTRIAILTALTITLLAPAAFAGTPGDAVQLKQLEQLEQKVFDQINSHRAARGLQPLVLVQELLPVARSHSKDQAGRMVLSHRDARGGSAGDRLDAARVPWMRYGENVALVKGHADPGATVVDAWLKSPGHAANIFDANLVEAAVGIAQAADGTLFMTQVFCAR